MKIHYDYIKFLLYFSLGKELIKYCLVLSFFISVTTASLVQMRVVKETANYGYFGNNVGDGENSNQLIASVLPANFSGPKLMERLVGRCYNLTQDNYRYMFCPFQNFTQYEISPRWNAYQGILGIWSHWEIENNTFSAMIYKNGDHCGDIDRYVKISFACGSNETLHNVTEPSKCQYSALFSTRYVCHKDALLVYPRLSSELQQEWDQLLTEFHYGDITQKGYDAGLQKIYHKAGFSERPQIKKSGGTTTEATSGNENTFTDLPSCNKEYKNLQNEVAKLNGELESLKLLIDLNIIEHNRTNRPRRVTQHQ